MKRAIAVAVMALVAGSAQACVDNWLMWMRVGTAEKPSMQAAFIDRTKCVKSLKKFIYEQTITAIRKVVDEEDGSGFVIVDNKGMADVFAHAICLPQGVIP